MAAIEAFIEQWGVTIGVGALMAYMVFVIWNLARESQAGKFGTFILFVALGAGILGFIIKLVIQYFLESGRV